jgi:hypothetical protein
VAREQPINAGPEEPRAPRERRETPLALKLIGGAILLAVVFIAAAIVGGGGGEGPSRPTPVAADELGFPGFATKNTTRIGGGSPTDHAAAAALAVFPSTDEASRPAAVAFVDADDWAGGIAAAVLMAAPVRAPVLVSDGAELPAVTSEALTALDPPGDRATGGKGIFAIGEASAPPGAGTARVGKGHGAAAAAAVARLRERLSGAPPAHLVIAPLEAPAFAMPAAAWAARSGDPVLFSTRKSLPKATATVLRRNPKAPVYVLGPSSAISSDALREISAVSDAPVHRVSGEDPVTNAIALARYADGDFGWDINDPGHGFVITRQEEPLDAAAVAPLSAAGTWGPLLLSDDAATLPAALREYLLDVKPGYTDDPTRAFYNHVWVVGDQEAIEVGQQAEIDGLAELAKIGGGP